MELKNLIKRYVIFILGLYFLSGGIVLIVKSALGTTPISSINYVLSLNTPLTLGTWTFIINMILIAGQFWLTRDCRKRIDVINILLQIPFSFIFSMFIDINMKLSENLVCNNYAMSLTLLALGCLTQAVGVVLELKPNVSMMSAEAFVNYASKRYNIQFGKLKVYFDVSLVMFAILLSLCLTHTVIGIREGTIVAACCTGHIVAFLNNKIMTRQNYTMLRQKFA